jgi:hypothetical protein
VQVPSWSRGVSSVQGLLEHSGGARQAVKNGAAG